MQDASHAKEPLDELSAASLVRKSFNVSMPAAAYPGHVTHLDIFSISIATFEVGTDGTRLGYRYGMVLVDGFSRRWQLYALRTLTEAEIALGLQWYAQLLGTGAMHLSHWVSGASFARRSIQTDGGTSLLAASVEKLLAGLGFSSTVTSAPDSPSSNGVAERAIRSIKTRLRSLMIRGGKIPVHDWQYAAWHAVASRNRLASRKSVGRDGTVKWLSPEELFFGVQPSFKHHVAFGARCRVLLVGARAQARGTLAQKAVMGRVYLWGGHGLQVRGTFRYVLGYVVRCDDGTLLYSRDVWVNETELVEGGHSSLGASQGERPTSSGGIEFDDDPEGAEEEDDGDAESVSDDESGSGDDIAATGNGNASPGVQQEDSPYGQTDFEPFASETAEPERGFPQTGSPEPVFSQPAEREGQIVMSEGAGAADSAPLPSPPLSPIPLPGEVDDGVLEETLPTLDLSHDPQRRDRTSRSRPQFFPASIQTVQAAVCSAVWEGQPVPVPRNYKEAMKSPLAEKWKAAVSEHLHGHDVLQTFVEEIVPEGTRTLPCQWIFDTKVDPEGNVTRFKARSVLLGNLQRAGIDFQQVFAPTIRPEQVRLLLAMGLKLSRKGLSAKVHPTIAAFNVISKADVKDAYLNSPLGEDEQPLHALPQGYMPKKKAPPGYKVVGRSIKAFPGLRQSGRAWWRMHKATLSRLGFKECPSAPCIYYKEMESDECIIAGAFVDDLIFLNLTSHPHAIEDLGEQLRDHYEIKIESELEKFLGAIFERHEDGLLMHLGPYVENMLERFEMKGCRPASTPEADAHSLSTSEDDERVLAQDDHSLFQSITGALMFAMVTCRPDLAHAVNMLARRMSRARVLDMKAARRVLQYLRGNARLGLLFKYGADPECASLRAYADADWANDPIQRKSTTGYIVFFNGAPVSWHSGLQGTISLSSCEAEYVALSECCREVDYLRSILDFVQHPADGPTEVFEDNQGTIDLASNPVHHKRTKHVEVKYHYVRDAQDKGRVRVVKVHTTLNHADIMTKATDQKTFTRHVSMIMVERRAPRHPT